MIIFQTILNLLTLVAIIIIVLLVRNYLQPYLKEKGKNLATKEDIEIITNKIERIRAEYVAEIEKLKAELKEESEILNKRRVLYDSIVKSLTVFSLGLQSDDKLKNQFIDDYIKAWLWAPDTVIKAINDLLSGLIDAPGSIDQETFQRLYGNCIIEMRKSSGYPNTTLNNNDYNLLSR